VLCLQTWQPSPLVEKCVKLILEGIFPSHMYIPFQLPAEELNWSGFKFKRCKAYGRKGHTLPFSRSWRLIVKFTNNENNRVLSHLLPCRKLMVFFWSLDSTVFCSTICDLTYPPLKMGGEKRLYCFKQLLTLK